MDNDISGPSPPARRRWRRWAVIGAAVAIAVAIVVYRSVTFVSQPPQQQGRRRFQEGNNQPVGVARIDRGDIRLSLRALGAVTPLATVTVTTQISGYLMSVGFKEGQLVKKGQLLAQIDPRPYEVALGAGSGSACPRRGHAQAGADGPRPATRRCPASNRSPGKPTRTRCGPSNRIRARSITTRRRSRRSSST